MSPPPDVSICIVNWNGREVLRNCLLSLQSQTGQESREIIVVDNASTDGSLELIAAEFPQVHVIANRQNRGFAAANNQAAQLARGRYLLFLNNDTVGPPGAVESLVRFLDQHVEYCAVGPKLIGADGKPQKSARNLPNLGALLHRNVLPIRWTMLFSGAYERYRSSFDPNQSGAVPQLAAAALLLRRDVFNSIGGWDEQFPFGLEDVDLCLRLAPHGQIYYLADIAITHLGRVSSHANRGWVLHSYQCGYVRFLRKHHRSRAAPRIYKTGVIAESPIRLLSLAMRVVGDSFSCDPVQRRRSRDRLIAQFSFMTKGLISFLRS